MSHEIFVHIVIDQDGNHAVGIDRESATEAYTSDIDDSAEALLRCRVITAILNVEMPPETTLTATVPAVADAVAMTIA